MKKSVISQKAQTELENRINNELGAEYLYRFLSNVMLFIGYFGASKFFMDESKQERAHYQKLVYFCNDCGFNPDLAVIVPSDKKINNIADAIQAAYDAERALQIAYEKMANDFMNEESVYKEALHFVKEQRKSVGEYGDLLSRLELCKNDVGALLQFDYELGKK